MKTSRRKFLAYGGLTSISTLFQKPSFDSQTKYRAFTADHFNMCGYAAPKLETVRIGFIGLGNRGPVHVDAAKHIEGTEIKGLCDMRAEKVAAVQKTLQGSMHNPTAYTQGANAWKKLCEQPDIDLVVIATPWHLHTAMATYAMEQGKHVCVEVPAAKTLDECWQLVETSEKNRKHCMIMENVCYDFFELQTLNMARQNVFGEIFHTEGAYIHTLLESNFSKDRYYDMWRLKENWRNGNLYPTHGLGPLAQVMNLNRGERLDYLTSMQSDDFMMRKKANELATTDPFFAPFANKSYRGNMNTTLMRTATGKTIMLQHDETSPNVYSRIFKISGEKGSALKYPLPGRYAFGHEDWVPEGEMDALEKKYEPPIVRKIGRQAQEIGGHGGMDFLMSWRTIDCLRNGFPLDIDVYDAALWSAIAPLSEMSVAKKSKAIDVPDFTRGAWKTNAPVDVNMKFSGETKVLA